MNITDLLTYIRNTTLPAFKVNKNKPEGKHSLAKKKNLVKDVHIFKSTPLKLQISYQRLS